LLGLELDIKVHAEAYINMPFLRPKQILKNEKITALENLLLTAIA